MVILYIGTDRSTELPGPLVGHKLKLIPYKNIHIRNIDEPVHAKNLCEVIEKSNRSHLKPFIIAIDACLGKPERVGMISMGRVLRRGGCNKPAAHRHIHIAGIVNISGFMGI